MTKNDLDRFGEIWKKQKLAFDAYSGKKASPERMEMFFDDLKSHDIDHVERAFELWRRTGKAFPKPADIHHALQQTRRPITTGELPEFDPENPHYCSKCGDNGFVEFWCPGHPDHPTWDDKPWRNREVAQCGFAHYAYLVQGQADWRGHEFYKPCLCRSTNPVLRARRAAGAV